MGPAGDCYDNAMCESFFATLECERIDRRTYRTHADARQDIFQFIEGWYNPHDAHRTSDRNPPSTSRTTTTHQTQIHNRPLNWGNPTVRRIITGLSVLVVDEEGVALVSCQATLARETAESILCSFCSGKGVDRL